MSAFLVEKVHIDLLADVAARGPRDARPGEWLMGAGARPEPTALGRMLWLENLRSVTYRYPDTASGGRPGPAGISDGQIAAYRFTAPPYRLTAVEAIKAVHCLRYQSCECPDYAETPAGKWAAEMLERLSGCVPAYAAAPWEWGADEIRQRLIDAGRGVPRLLTFDR